MARATSQVPPSATLSQSITPQVSPLKRRPPKVPPPECHPCVVLGRHSRYATAMPPGAMSSCQTRVTTSAVNRTCAPLHRCEWLCQ